MNLPNKNKAADFQYPSTSSNSGLPSLQRPFARLIDQPDTKPKKFRYESEGRATGGTYTIQILNYTGPADIYVTCVTAEEHQYKAHPHRVTGPCTSIALRDGGVGFWNIQHVQPENNRVSFNKLGIKYVKKQNTGISLIERKHFWERERKGGDPFNQGFSHMNKSMDPTRVRLCFEVFIFNPITGKCDLALEPVVSNIISNKPDLKIFKVSTCVSFAGEENEVLIFCNKETKREDITVKFFKDDPLSERWTADATITLVHGACGVSFKPPKYPFLATEPVRCKFMLYRPSDGKCSEPFEFEFHPQRSERIRESRFASQAEPMADLPTILDEIRIDSSPMPPAFSHSNFSDYDNFVSKNQLSVKLNKPTQVATLRPPVNQPMEISLEVDSDELRHLMNQYITDGKNLPELDLDL